MGQNKRIFWIIAGLAALAVVVFAWLFQRSVFDTGKDTEQPTVSSLDERGQSSRIRSSSAANGAEAETEREWASLRKDGSPITPIGTHFTGTGLWKKSELWSGLKALQLSFTVPLKRRANGEKRLRTNETPPSKKG